MGCLGTVRRTSWAWARPWDQMKQSRWNETIWIKLLRHNTCYKKRDKTCRTKPVRHDLIRHKLKENFSGEQPLGKTSGTEAVGQDPRNRTERQTRVGEKLKAKPLGRTFGLSLRRQGLGDGTFGSGLSVKAARRVKKKTVLQLCPSVSVFTGRTFASHSASSGAVKNCNDHSKL